MTLDAYTAVTLEELARSLRGSTSIGAYNRGVFASIDSTNALGKRMASFYRRQEETPPDTVLVALEQSRGRGRLGNSWLSPRGGIYVSLLSRLRPSIRPESLPMTVAVAMCRALDRWCDGACRVKWPNDLMLGGRKLAGILIELVGSEPPFAAVVGFGVNYAAAPPELARTATSLADELATVPPLTEVLVALVEAVETQISRTVNEEDLVGEYASRSLHSRGDTLICRTLDGVHRGTFLGFGPAGYLRLDTQDGERAIAAGEIIDRASRGDHE